MKIFLSPHNDDEALFGSYIIMKEHPLVIIVTDSYIQYKRGEGITAEQRKNESREAMKMLKAEIKFLGIKDNELTEKNLTNALKKYNPEIVYAPAIEGGNFLHDLVGKVADKLFKKVFHYSTYTKTRWYPKGKIKIETTENMKKLKLRVLKCYPSQANLKETECFFTTKYKDEYLI